MNCPKLRSELDISQLTGISVSSYRNEMKGIPVLGGIAVDSDAGLVLATERATGQVLRLSIPSGQLEMLPLPVADFLGDICMDESGKVYVSDSACVRSYDRSFATEQTINTPNTYSLHLCGMLNRGFVAYQYASNIVRYGADGAQLWTCRFPSGLTDAIPTSKDGRILIVTASSRIVIFELDDEGNPLGARDIAPAQSQPGLGRTPDGKNVIMSIRTLHDAVADPEPGTVLMLYSLGLPDKKYKDVLLYYEWGGEVRVFDLPIRVTGIRMFGKDKLAAYAVDFFKKECKVFLFDAPNWKSGTRLDDLVA